jgi:hypothetical protein
MRGIEIVSADALLGGRAVFARAPRSSLEWVDVVRHGISSRALDSMLKSIGFVRKGEDLPAGDATMHFLRKRVCRMNSTG